MSIISVSLSAVLCISFTQLKDWNWIDDNIPPREIFRQLGVPDFITYDKEDGQKSIYIIYKSNRYKPYKENRKSKLDEEEINQLSRIIKDLNLIEISYVEVPVELKNRTVFIFEIEDNEIVSVGEECCLQ